MTEAASGNPRIGADQPGGRVVCGQQFGSPRCAALRAFRAAPGVSGQEVIETIATAGAGVVVGPVCARRLRWYRHTAR